MLSLKLIVNIRAFMERAHISGAEVPAYNEVMTALQIEEREIALRAEMEAAKAKAARAQAVEEARFKAAGQEPKVA